MIPVTKVMVSGNLFSNKYKWGKSNECQFFSEWQSVPCWMPIEIYLLIEIKKSCIRDCAVGCNLI